MDARLCEYTIKFLARRADEGMPALILFAARGFTDKRNLRPFIRTFSSHFRSIAVERALETLRFCASDTKEFQDFALSVSLNSIAVRFAGITTPQGRLHSVTKVMRAEDIPMRGTM